MRKTVTVILLLLALLSFILLLVRFGAKPLMSIWGEQDRAGLRVESIPDAKVKVDGEEMGGTPFQKEDFEAGEYLVSVEKDKFSWQGYVKLISGTLTVVNRELAQSKSAQSGEVITLEEGKGLPAGRQGVTILSSPDASDVEIDGKSYGKTPLYISDLVPGEHTFLLSHSNFLKRSIKAILPDGYNLMIKVDLAISEADLTSIQSEPVQSQKELIVKNTPVGFLRVRSKPSTSSEEIARVSPGDTLILLEETPGWKRVKLPDGKEGYVSSAYVEEKE